MANHVTNAQKLFARLSAGDIAGYGDAEFMANDIRSNLQKAGADAAALDPSGEKSADEMTKALNEATAKLQIAHAQKLFARLSAGDIAGYGDAEFMANDIRSNLQKAGADAAALDPSGEKSADEMTKALDEAVLKQKFAIGSRPGRNVAEG